ncbi:MAG: tetratricopeptide repeat protein, partial [Candidatus Kapaibacteriota bacterium]
MKKLIIIFLLLPISLLYSRELNYAKRLLKLANTNIWLEKYQEASFLVEQAKQIISRFNTWEARYWDAVADETLGRVYLQMGNYDFAEMHFKKAFDKFDKLLDRNFEGSQLAMKSLIEQTQSVKEKTKETFIYESQGKNVNLSYRAISGYLNLPMDLVGFTAVESNLNQFPSELY